jgi:hypothetical protein
MKYHLTQLKISLSKFTEIILNFFDSVIYKIGRALNLIKNSKKTKMASYHVKKTGKILISQTKENAWNWNHRLISSGSFRIFDEDV